MNSDISASILYFSINNKLLTSPKDEYKVSPQISNGRQNEEIRKWYETSELKANYSRLAIVAFTINT